jgi:ammonium transporter Rh
MSFLRRYGLGAVGFTMILTAVAVQLNVFVELLCRYVYLSVGGEPGGEADDTVFPLPLTVATFVDGEFAAATLLISYGAVIGRASPLQLVVMALCQSLAYAFNKVVLVLGLVGAEDVGGSMTIHMFGAYFGLAVSYVLGRPKPSTSTNADPSAVSDLTALIGTTLLWVYWPSFVGATETGIPENENVCVMHTVLALLGSTGAAFYASHRLCHHKFDPVHIANSTLAGGVAVGSSARLNMTPAGALGLGIVAGILSVYGYVYSTPYLERAFNVYDTCGVGNLHGLPSLLGGLSSVIFVAISGGSSDVNADEFLKYGTGFGQCTRQVAGVFCTLLVSVGSGYATGKAMTSEAVASELEGGGKPDEYDDGVWWEGEYFEKAVEE